MAGSNVLLDTVIVAGYFNRDAQILAKLSRVTAYVSTITIGELLFGAYNSGRVQENVENVRKFAATTVVLQCDTQTADWYSQVKKTLRSKGRPIPENDIWIAATALQYGLILVTRDTHFQAVETW